VVGVRPGAGTTTTTAELGAILAAGSEGGVVALDAGGGALGRYAPSLNSPVYMRHLVAFLDEYGFDIRKCVTRSPSGLEILADAAGAVGSAGSAPPEPLDAVTYSALVAALSPYAVVLTDCGSGLDGLATFAALTGADQRVFVSDLSQAGVAATAAALTASGALASRSHVVLTGVPDGSPPLDPADPADPAAAVAQLLDLCPSVVVVPFGEGEPGRVGEAALAGYRELAAAVGAGFAGTRRRKAAGSDAYGGVPDGEDEESGGIQEWTPGGPPPMAEERGAAPEPQASGGEVPDPSEEFTPDYGTGRYPQPPSLEYEELQTEDFHVTTPPSASVVGQAPSPMRDFLIDEDEDIHGGAWPSEPPPTAPRESPPPRRQLSTQRFLPDGDEDRPDADRAEPEPQGGSTVSGQGSAAPMPQVPPAGRGTLGSRVQGAAGQRDAGPMGMGSAAGPGASGPMGRGIIAGQGQRRPIGSGTGEPRTSGRTPTGSGSEAPGGYGRGSSGPTPASANDERWQQAAQLRNPRAGGVAPSGLPRRVPRANLVEGAAASAPPDGPQISRAPEDIRGRLSDLRRGVQEGRASGTGTRDDQVTSPVPPPPPPFTQAPPQQGSSERPQIIEAYLRPAPDQFPAPTPSATQGTFRLTPRPSLPDPLPGLSLPAPGPDPLSAPRHLVAELAELAAPNQEIPLHVQITREPATPQNSTAMRPFPVPPTGARLTVTVHAPGLRVLGDLQQQVTVYPGEDSEVLYFGLRTVGQGLYGVTVRAFHEGTHLGDVRCQISVTEGEATRQGPRRQALLPGIAFEPGEVTLQVHRNPEDGSFTFQLLSETCYPPTRFHGGDPRHGAERIYAELREAARMAGRSFGTATDAARLRDRLKNHGVQLWASAVPEAVQEQFWAQADRVTSFTVLGEHDFMPWELLYPLDQRHDNGFLAEWLPVVRRVFGQDRVHQLPLPGAAFVVPPGSPPEAAEEVAALRGSLGPGVRDDGLLTERAALTALVERGHAGLLHFACHNAFSGSGSRVTMGDGSFDPIDLATAAQTRSLRAHHPLVFFNACRSAGEIDWFGSSLGWAPQFLQAGAGAFVGTLWPVRSRSAMEFAKEFYGQLLSAGQPLGQASLAARRAVRDQDGDPTWLAYAVYGSPAATATPA